MKTVIYGNGAIARLVYSYARHRLPIAGFTVDDHCIAPGTEQLLGLPLAPFSRVEMSFPPASHDMLMAVGFLDMNALRAHKSAQARAKSYSLARYVHESVTQHDDVVIGENCVILDHVSIHPGCRIGEGTFISSNVNIGHDCQVGEYTWINSGTAIGGECRIGPGCFFGVNASAAHRIRIGARNFIAANTLINRHTEDDQVYLSDSAQLFKLPSRSFLNFSRNAG
jgi:sugar O-acyltransferase (sialic acid O-acetyltransferase NeuD family)